MIALKHLPAVLLLGLATLPAAANSICAEPEAHPLTIEIADTPKTVQKLCPEDLDRISTASFSTRTLWTSGEQHFEGVWLATLLQDLGLSEGDVTLRAINDYAVTERVAAFQEGGALVAYRRNGKIMTPRDKGPYWLVWNYDADPAFRSEKIYALSIWQLDRITVSR